MSDPRQPRWIVKAAWLIFAALALALMLAPRALRADPRVCVMLADYGLTAAALAKQERAGRLARATADEILGDMYTPNEPPPENVARLLATVRRRAEATDLEPNAFALQLNERCNAFGGNPMFLGTDL